MSKFKISSDSQINSIKAIAAMDYPGNLFVVAAPSGAGKSSLVKALMELDSHVQPSVSHTTRSPRGQEKHGREYFFVSQQEFDAMVLGDGFVDPAAQGLYRGMSHARVGDRLQLTARIDPTSRVKSFVLKPATGADYRLVLDIYPGSGGSALNMLNPQMRPTAFC